MERSLGVFPSRTLHVDFLGDAHDAALSTLRVNVSMTMRDNLDNVYKVYWDREPAQHEYADNTLLEKGSAVFYLDAMMGLASLPAKLCALSVARHR